MNTTLNWETHHNSIDWDQTLANLGGHPLQSSLWGEARKHAEGIEYQCFIAYKNQIIQALARVEIRKIPLLGRIAWIPQGPKTLDDQNCLPSLTHHLKSRGFILCACTPWQTIPASGKESPSNSPKTIWIDLTIGKEQLLKNLDKQWRYGARRALRENVVIEQTYDANDIAAFYHLCQTVSDNKGFKLPASQPLMENLLFRSKPESTVSAHLFIARHNNKLCAGVFIIRSGKNIHYIWGGMDRAYSKLYPGEAVQWAVIEWAVSQGCALYDLEGIDPENNPGTYKFKKKMGGTIISLSNRIVTPISFRGQLISKLL